MRLPLQTRSALARLRRTYSELAVDDIRATLLSLEPLEQQVLTLRYGLDDGVFRALDEVAARLGLSRSQARLHEGAALRKLRSQLYDGAAG